MTKNLFLLMVLGATAVTAVLALAPEGNSATAQQTAGAANAQPVLVELFTSQGCSSCPPADKLLARLDTGGGVVALSRPVTYWDRLGWKDTLARPAHDDLQRRYAARGLPGGGVFTPEAVVQGTSATVGSDERALRKLIISARGNNPVLLTQAGGRVTASRAVPSAELRFVAVASNRAVKIGRGENGGRDIGYTNVVLNEAAVACAPSAVCSAAMPAVIAGQKGADRWAAVLQDKAGGRVQAVRWIGRPGK
ncbi:DUF1223 domain-containing protein [Sphingopyxis sp.]|uniref:DUF1223 domain-containing protein n=1 Tax=Sphingopyxis sp. TaxID=1908224 RepID=UPI003D14FD56